MLCVCGVRFETIILLPCYISGRYVISEFPTIWRPKAIRAVICVPPLDYCNGENYCISDFNYLSQNGIISHSFLR